MKHKLRFVAMAVGIGSLAVAAQAVTISGVSGTLEDGSSLGPQGPGVTDEGYTFIPGPGAGPGASGIELHTVNNTLGPGGPAPAQTVTFAYTVTADPGMRIVGYQVSPTMYLYEADGQINLNHSGFVDNNHFSDPLDPLMLNPGTSVGIWSRSVTPTTSLSVAGSYAISLKNDPAWAFASAQDLQVTYTEAPVPEPSAMVVLGLGGVGLISRRRRSK
jgi:hypothetical protein